VTLLAVVQEEFGNDLKVEDMESFASFEAVLERVHEASGLESSFSGLRRLRKPPQTDQES
jgi:hypothetical protein